MPLYQSLRKDSEDDRPLPEPSAEELREWMARIGVGDTKGAR
jgi:hypothetical protein